MKKVCNVFSVLVFAVLLFPFAALGGKAQTGEWAKRYDSGGGDVAHVMAVDISGSIYVSGDSSGDFTTIKYDTNGNELWVRSYDSVNARVVSIAVDPLGNVYITGYGGDSITIKYDASGNELWIKRFAGNPAALAVDSAGNVFVTGKGSYSLGSANTVTVKYSQDGVELWQKRYDGPHPNENATDIAVDVLGNVYVLEYTDSFVAPSYVIKYNTNGRQLFVKQYDGHAHSISADSNGIYVTGQTAYPYDYLTVKYRNSK